MENKQKKLGKGFVFIYFWMENKQKKLGKGFVFIYFPVENKQKKLGKGFVFCLFLDKYLIIFCKNVSRFGVS